MGFYTLILLAGLQAIPGDLYEAAEMDAATPWRRFSRITLPLLMPNLVVVLVLGLIRAVQIFDEVFVLTGGGPGSATTFIVQFIYQTGFAESIHQYGLAAAASLVLALSLFLLTLVQLRVTRRSMAGRTGRDDA
jgi:alpha-1,4-digalacturonate transport system permease protein